MYLKKLLSTKKTVFTIVELKRYFGIVDDNYARVLISRMLKNEQLIRIYAGIYSYSQNYNDWELANKIKKPSYISLESVLIRQGVIFQDYGNTIFSISDNTVQKKSRKTQYKYYKIKDDILNNPLGIEFGDVISKASVERAICDRIYLTSGYYFDNLGSINKNKLLEISKIYNKRVYLEVKKHVE